jgi:hypothetical protein
MNLTPADIYSFLIVLPPDDLKHCSLLVDYVHLQQPLSYCLALF